MKEIPLSQNKVALVDDEDFEHLSQWKWSACEDYNTFYATRKIDATSNLIYMHKTLCVGKYIDHIDGNGLNNQKINLRACTMSQNQANRGKQKNNKSGFKGVSWKKCNKKWVAQITVNGEKKYLGLFKNKEDAATAYKIAAIKYFGEFAKC